MRSTLGLLACLGLAACSSTEPNGSGSPFLISNPVPNPAVLAVLGTAASAGDLVYVSLPMGTIPNGVSAVIVNQRTGQSVGADLIDGGLDPIGISGVASDTLDIIVTTRDGGQEHFTVTVPIRARPKVVRTEPTPHKRDVPLNASIIVVFSEPIGAGSLNGSTLQLKWGAATVEGQIAFLDNTHASVTFTPSALLAPSSEYDLLVSSAIRDLDGDPLEDNSVVPFTTALGPEVGELRVSVSTFGNAPDPDGYVVAIAGQPTRAIGLNDTLSFQLPTGTYTTYLSGLAPYCLVLGQDSARLTVWNGTVTTLSFKVECPRVPNDGLLVTVSTQVYGTGWPANMSFAMKVDGGPDQTVGANGYAIVSPIAPGTHTVAIHTGGPFCGFGSLGGDGWSHLTTTVPPETFGRVDFRIVCIP